MTDNFFINWGIVSVSVFNTLILFWLGFTVLLNAERLRFGVYLSGAGLIFGGIFFLIHTSIFVQKVDFLGKYSQLLWYILWILLILLPYIWYLLILWHVGFWESKTERIRTRHKIWFYFITFSAILLILFLFIFTIPPEYDPFSNISRNFQSYRRNGNELSLILFIYPIYIILCISMAIDAMRFPAKSRRLMGIMARKKAKPWLMGTSILLLIVSLLVTVFLIWFILNLNKFETYSSYFILLDIISKFDLLIETIILISIILLGQAIVSYEIFTGKNLPYKGLFRNWINILIISSGYSIIIGAGLNSSLSPVYYLLLTALLMVFAFSLMGWIFYKERERYISYLRPFITSQHLFENAVYTNENEHVDIKTPFYALCKNVLEASQAYLFPVGQTSTFSGNAIFYAESTEYETDNKIPKIDNVLKQINSTEKVFIQLEENDKYLFALPLWSQKGLTGILFLGKKVDNGFYTQEEIEIARNSCERFIDTKISSEIAKSLINIQRKNISETNIIDNKTRRVLHDDILPLIHTSMIQLSSINASQDILNNIHESHKKISDLLRNMSYENPDINKLGLVTSIQKNLKSEFISNFDFINIEVDTKVKEKEKKLPPFVSEVIYYACREIIRNSAKYGKDNNKSSFVLDIKISGERGIEIVIEDNGVGTNLSVSEKGNGHGLILHSTMMAVIGGSLDIESIEGEFTKVKLNIFDNSVFL